MFLFFLKRKKWRSVPAQVSDWEGLEFSLITDQLRWTVGLLRISSMEWDNLLQGWDSMPSSMQTPSSVFPLFHCFSIGQYSDFLFCSANVPFVHTTKCLCLWSLVYSLKGKEGKFLLRLVSCPHQDFITWPITGRSQWLYVTAEFPENCNQHPLISKLFSPPTPQMELNWFNRFFFYVYRCRSLSLNF